MNHSDFIEASECVNVIASREELINLKVSDFPQLNADTRSSLHREIHKTAYPNLKKKVITFDDLERLF